MLSAHRLIVTRHGKMSLKIQALSTSSMTIMEMQVDASVDVSDITKGRRRARNIAHSAKPEALVTVVAEAVHAEATSNIMLRSLRDDADPPI